MPFTKETGAKAGKASSRKNSPNKEVKALRVRIETLLDEQWELIINDFSGLTPKERIDSMIKLLEYALPKLNRTEIREMTSVEDFLQMTPQERQERIFELQRKIINK